MGIQFEILVNKNKFLTDRPKPAKQGRVRGNKNIFKVGLMDLRVIRVIKDISRGGSFEPVGAPLKFIQCIKHFQ